MRFSTEQKLKYFIEKEKKEEYTITFVTKTVCEFYKLDELDVRSKKRKTEISKARQISMYLISINCEASLNRIGVFFNKDHATVLHSKRTIGKYLTWDRDLQEEISKIQDILRFTSGFLENNDDIQKGYYYINLGKIRSLKISNDKAIILKGLTKEEENIIKAALNIMVESREHSYSSMYILEKKEPKI